MDFNHRIRPPRFARGRPGVLLCPLFVLIFPLAALNCSALGKGGEKRLETRELSIERSGALPVLIRVEIARTDDERSRGLMNRKELPDGEGMIFVFDRDQILSFWMKNTSIPLSIAFIAADGRILEIRHLEPGDLRPVSSSRSVRYALEVPRDWFSRAGAGVGDRIQVGF